MDTQDTVAEEFDFLQTGPASTSGRSDAELLKSALMNEKASPEILQYETDLIGRVEQNMDYQVRLSRRAGGLRAAASGGGRQASRRARWRLALPSTPITSLALPFTRPPAG